MLFPHGRACSARYGSVIIFKEQIQIVSITLQVAKVASVINAFIVNVRLRVQCAIQLLRRSPSLCKDLVHDGLSEKGRIQFLPLSVKERRYWLHWIRSQELTMLCRKYDK